MSVVRAALDAADAGRLVRQALASPDVERALQAAAAIDVVAVGKAAGPMLNAWAAGSIVPFRHAAGIGTEQPPTLPRGARWYTAAHPVPDERSVAAARAVLGIAAGAGTRDLLVLLLSGGSSALMALPSDGIALGDKQRTSRRLLRQGAEIHALNAVRKHLSAIKGGQLAAAVSGSVLTFAVSDVVGDDLFAIGSGPTVPDPSTFEEALSALDRYGGRTQYPSAIVVRLTQGVAGGIAETPKVGDPRLLRSDARVIGGSRVAVDGARTAAAALGYAVHVLREPVTGEARLAGQALVEAARLVALTPPAEGRPLCILASGETTVRVAGAGKGGRNQHCALAMVRGLDAIGTGVVAASIGTDGVDGPTDAAGSVVDTTTLARAEAAGLGPPERYLEAHNSYVFFDQLGDLIKTGPTNTNVGDLQIILVAA